MRYYMIADNAYIYEIGVGDSGEEISEELYEEIMDLVRAKPAATDTTDYRLTICLEWEAYPIEPIEPTDIDAETALSIILGEDQNND